MTPLDHTELARRISSDVGMEFESSAERDSSGAWLIDLTPAKVPDGHAFAVRVRATWRRLRLSFQPQRFAGELIATMGTTSETGRAGFQAILEQSVALGATVQFIINGHLTELDDESVWGKKWNRFDLKLSKRLQQLDRGGTVEELDAVCGWTRRFVAALLAISPLEAEGSSVVNAAEGAEEGAAKKTQAIRYERDRRNRAAAIAIHGTSCKACGLEFGARYGQVAEGFIEVHHTQPLSTVREAYIVNPLQDLVPLCPNCHAVAHRRTPPLTVDEIRDLLK